MSARFTRNLMASYVEENPMDVNGMKILLTQRASRSAVIGQAILDAMVRAHSDGYPNPTTGYTGWGSTITCINNLDGTFTIGFHSDKAYVTCTMEENDYSEIMASILSNLKED